MNEYAVIGLISLLTGIGLMAVLFIMIPLENIPFSLALFTCISFIVIGGIFLFISQYAFPKSSTDIMLRERLN